MRGRHPLASVSGYTGRAGNEAVMCNCKNRIHGFKCTVRNIFDIFIPGK